MQARKPKANLRRAPGKRVKQEAASRPARSPPAAPATSARPHPVQEATRVLQYTRVHPKRQVQLHTTVHEQNMRNNCK